MVYAKYEKPNCRYFCEKYFVNEYDLGLAQDSAWTINIYTIIENRLLYSYTSSDTEGKDFLFGLELYDVRDRYNRYKIDIYSIIEAKKNGEYVTLGYIIHKNMQFQKKRPSLRQLRKLYPNASRSHLRYNYRKNWN